MYIAVSSLVGYCFGFFSMMSQFPAYTKVPSLMDMALDEMQYGLEKGLFTTTDLVETYLRRIEEVNPTVKAITELDPTALDQARALDAERASKKVRGPLHGVVMIVKNQFATYNLNNTSGSTCLLGARTGRDAAVIKKLRDAGVIILGISNLTQWGNNRNPPTAGNGWSADGGQAVGVFLENQDPWGSSTGSATGTALGLAWAGLGTEVEGSISCVAERSNLVGLKPTAGLVTRDLVMVSKRLGSVGPITRTVKDAAAILTVIAGKCSKDPGTQEIPFDQTPDYTKSCVADGLRGARFGVPRNALKGNPPGAELTQYASETFEKTIELLQSRGATVVNTSFESFEESLTSKSPALVKGTDFKLDLAAYLRQLEHNPNNIKSLGDIIRWTQTDPREEYPSRGTQSMENAWGALNDRDSTEFKAALRYTNWLAHEGGVRGALEKDNLDALIMPTAVSPLVPHLGGYPIISVPMGIYPDGTEFKNCPRGNMVERGPNLPFGLSFIGDRFSEEKLIKYAYAFEQQTQVRKQGRPIIVPTSELRQRTDSWFSLQL